MKITKNDIVNAFHILNAISVPCGTSYTLYSVARSRWQIFRMDANGESKVNALDIGAVLSTREVYWALVGLIRGRQQARIDRLRQCGLDPAHASDATLLADCCPVTGQEYGTGA